MSDDVTDGEYYPLRWKFADAVEDVFVLHRGKAIGFIAVSGLAFIVVGFLLLGWGSTRVKTDTAASTSQPSEPSPSSSDASSSNVSSSTSPTTITKSTTSTTTSSTTSTTTIAPPSARAATSEAELAATEPGAVIELSTATVRVVGGLPDDEKADEAVALAEAIFTDMTVEDLQIVDQSFDEPDVVRFRLSAPDLFGYNSDVLNATYVPLIDRLAEAIVAAETWNVEVTGHTDDSGPSEGNQRLSDRRAASAAQELISRGAPAAQVTSIGLGEDEPIASNDTEEGRLANRRVEFVVHR